MQKKEGVLIDEDKKIYECFEAQDLYFGRISEKTTGNAARNAERNF